MAATQAEDLEPESGIFAPGLLAEHTIARCATPS